MHASTLVRLAQAEGGAFRIHDSELQVRRIPDHLRPTIRERRDELRDYLLLRCEHGARCRQCGEPPVERLSDHGLCWRCELDI